MWNLSQKSLARRTQSSGRQFNSNSIFQVCVCSMHKCVSSTIYNTSGESPSRRPARSARCFWTALRPPVKVHALGVSTNWSRRATKLSVRLGGPCSVQSASSPRALGIGSSTGLAATLRSVYVVRAPHVRVAAMRCCRVAIPASSASPLPMAICDDGESIEVDTVGAPCVAAVADRAIDRRRFDMLEDRARRRLRRGSLGSFVRCRQSVHHSLHMRLADRVSSRRRARRYGHRLRVASAHACGRVDCDVLRIVNRVCGIGKLPRSIGAASSSRDTNYLLSLTHQGDSATCVRDDRAACSRHHMQRGLDFGARVAAARAVQRAHQLVERAAGARAGEEAA